MRAITLGLLFAFALASEGCGAIESSTGDTGQGQRAEDGRKRGREDLTPSQGEPRAPSAPVPPPIATLETLAAVSGAIRLACSPTAIYAATRQGTIVAVPLDGGPASDVAPAPAGVVGFLAWSQNQLFYTLPDEGEVHVRDLASAADVRLAAGQASPQGIAVSGAEVFFGTATGIASVSSTAADQIPEPRVVYATHSGQFPRGATLGLALAGVRFIVAHAPSMDDSSGSLGTYSSTDEQISHYTFFSKTIGVAASATRTYWSESDGTVRSGPRPILSTGLQPTAVVSSQISLGDICLQGGRLYFTAANDDDVREIRWIDVE
jgi:hypothetical protein